MIYKRFFSRLSGLVAMVMAGAAIACGLAERVMTPRDMIAVAVLAFMGWLLSGHEALL